MTPKDMGNGLLVIGVVMLVLAVPLSIVATLAVQDTIDSSSVRTAENTWEDEEWLTSVSYRDYYAYDLTNVDELNEFPIGWNKTPNFQLKGPYTYKVITERVFVNHNSTSANYEYTESSSFESCFDVDCEGNGPGEDPREQVSNLNVPYATLRVATLPDVFKIIRESMEARFAMKMMEEEVLVNDNDFPQEEWFATNDDYNDFLYGGIGTSNPTGILADGNEPIYFGVTHFVESANSDKEQTMNDYGIISVDGMDEIMEITDNWLNSVSTYEVSGEHIVNDEGEPYSENSTENITASDYANMSFGGVDPLDGSYSLFGLNYGGFLNLDQKNPDTGEYEKVIINTGNKLGGELLDILSTPEGAIGVVYMSLAGVTPPAIGSGYGPGGLEFSKWIGFANGYGVDTFQAVALEHLTMNVAFNNLVPIYLEGIGAKRWTTLSINEWLFGWHDSATAFALSGSSDNYSTGWFSLDANASYYLTPELVSLGVDAPEIPSSWIVRNTGEQDLSKLNQLMTENNLSELSWHSEEMYQGTYGLVEWEPNGLRFASGGWVEGTNIKCEENNFVKYNLAGFVVPNVPCVGSSNVKGIETIQYSTETNATERLIQAKLLNTKSLLDAVPGSIPLYFGATADFHAEPKTGYIIKGDVISTFYLDVAALNNPTKDAPTSVDELQPVFMIEIHQELDEEQADQIKSQIYTNQNIVTWWTNFDTPFDFILPVLVLISAASFFFGSKILIENETDITEEE